MIGERRVVLKPVPVTPGKRQMWRGSVRIKETFGEVTRDSVYDLVVWMGDDGRITGKVEGWADAEHLERMEQIRAQDVSKYAGGK